MSLHDLPFATRMLARRPGFALAAIVTFALGVGANAAVFSVVHAILLRPLPYPQPDRLVAVWPDRFVSNAELLFLRERTRVYQRLAALAPGWTMAMTGAGEPVQLTVSRTSDDFLVTLGAPPRLGRVYGPGDAAPGAARVLVISHELWQTKFQGDRAVLTKRVALDGDDYAIIGVMPPGFESGGRRADAWQPLVMDPGAWYHRGAVSFLVGRLAPGATVERATDELRALVAEWGRAFGYSGPFGEDAHVIPLHELVAGDIRPTLVVALAAVGLILLVASANLATLLLGRAVARAREMAVRSALGASRGRLTRQLLAECAVLVAAGTMLGVGLAAALLPSLKRLLPPEVPRVTEIGIEPTAIAITAIVSAAVAMLFGASPALAGVRADLQAVLRISTGASASRDTHRLRGAMVVAEVALALVLVAGAGLMLRTMWQLNHVDPGFDGAHVLAMRVQRGQPFASPAEGRAFYRALLDRVASIPGVERVGAVQHLPMSGFHWRASFEVDGRPLPPGVPAPGAGWRIVAGDYFRAMRIPVVAGNLSAFPGHPGSQAVVVNQGFAERLFGRSDAVGRRIRVAGRGEPGPWTTIAAVVGNVRHDGPDQAAPAEVYASLDHIWMPTMMLAVRFRSGVALDPVPVREAIWSVDPQVPVAGIEPVGDLVARRTARPRAIAVLLSAFAAVALLLGAVGVYGVVAQSVTQRTREIGIRLALGAPRALVSRRVVTEGVLLGAAGIAVGLAGTLVLTRWMSAVVFGVTPHDPATLVASATCLLLITAAAAYVPARRAARIDPLGALRQE